MKKSIFILLAFVLILMTGCTQKAAKEDTKQTNVPVSQEETKETTAKDDGHVAVDVRSQDEYDSGLIPGEIVTEDMTDEEHADAVKPVPTLVIEANGHIFYAAPEDNSSAEALIEKLSAGEIQLELQDYGGFEKVGPLPWDLPRNDESITTVPGDVILYQGNQIAIYYDENTWDFTRLTKIEGVTKEDLLEVFGEGDVTVKLWAEWSE